MVDVAGGFLLAAVCFYALPAIVPSRCDAQPPRRLVLAPLAGQKLSLRYYQRQCLAWDEAAPRVWIGRKLTDREAAEAVRAGRGGRAGRDRRVLRGGPLVATRYLNVPILDSTAPTAEQLARCVAFVADSAARGVG